MNNEDDSTGQIIVRDALFLLHLEYKGWNCCNNRWK